MELYTKAVSEMIEGTKLFVASDDIVDRQGESIDQSGWQLENFKKNPVIQWGHDYSHPAIGKATKIGFKMVNGIKKLVFEPIFHKKDDLSRLVSDLVNEGWITASSVGFKPLDQVENTYTKAELLEISFVNVPANPNALGLAFSKGYSAETVKTVMPDADVEEEKTITYKKYPLAEEDLSFDVTAEKADASTGDLAKMSAWSDGTNYKFVHHQLSGFKTVLTGVKSAMEELIKDSEIPEADKREVHNHLAKHYQEFGREVPELRSADAIIASYASRRQAEDMVADLTKSVNTFIEETKEELEKKKKIAENNTELFTKSIEKRFEDIELNVKGIAEGINPTDAGLEQRFLNVEENINELAKGIRAIIASSVKGEIGRQPNRATESKDQSRQLVMKALNIAVEAMNKVERK